MTSTLFRSHPREAKTGALQRRIQDILAPAGVALDGEHPYDPRIHDPATYTAILQRGSLGLAEAYMSGWWDCDQLDELICRALDAGADGAFGNYPALVLATAVTRLTNPQRRSRAFEVGVRHYDLSNEFFRAMLGPTMAYSCAYWERGAATLDEAQTAKFDLICQKMGLRAGQRVLDIGCGWGSLAGYMARTYGVEVVGLTVSREQEAYARDICTGLPIDIRLQDYRDLAAGEEFDRIVSVGMFEHVGYKNFHEYMRVAANALRDDGLFLLHSIVGFRTDLRPDPFLDKYIFPNGYMPSLAQITSAADGLFIVEDVQNIGAGYDPTLMAWYRNFEESWPEFEPKFGDSARTFHRMWKYYLLSCAGAFRARKNQVYQIVFAKNGVPGGYRSVR